MGKNWWIFLLCIIAHAGCAGPNQRLAEKRLKAAREAHIASTDFERLCYQDCWNKLSHESLKIKLTLSDKPKEEIYQSYLKGPIPEFEYCLDSQCEHLIQDFGLDDRPAITGYEKENQNKVALD